MIRLSARCGRAHLPRTQMMDDRVVRRLVQLVPLHGRAQARCLPACRQRKPRTGGLVLELRPTSVPCRAAPPAIDNPSRHAGLALNSKCSWRTNTHSRRRTRPLRHPRQVSIQPGWQQCRLTQRSRMPPIARAMQQRPNWSVPLLLIVQLGRLAGYAERACFPRAAGNTLVSERCSSGNRCRAAWRRGALVFICRRRGW
jgi:hypothetical protein